MAKKAQSADVSEIFEIRVRPQTNPMDAVDEYLKKLAQQEFLEAQLAKLQQIRLKAQLEAKKAEQELKKLEAEEEEAQSRAGGGDGGITPEMVQVAQRLAQMPEEQRNEVIRYLALLKSLEARNPSASAIGMAILLSGLQQHQRTGDSGAWEVAKLALNKLFDTVLTRREERKEGDDLERSLAKEFVDLLKQLATNRPDPRDEIARWLSFFKDMGLAPFGAQYDPRIIVELEKLRFRRWLAMQKIKLKEKELALKEKELRQRERQRKALMKRLATTVLSALTEPEERELTQQPQGRQLPEGYMEIECPRCHTKNVVPVDAEYMTCVGCGTRYRIRRLSGGERAEERVEGAPEGGGHGSGTEAAEAGGAHTPGAHAGRAQVVSY